MSGIPVTYQETAYAKINLALHVRQKLPNGYHEIETIFAFLDTGDIVSVEEDDRVSVEEGDRISLSIKGRFADGLDDQNNLVLEAAHLLASSQNIEAGASIKLEKNLPIASGIGGGSADAAAVLRLLNRFWNVGLTIEKLADLAKPLGADVPACVISKTCRGEGIGQDLTLLETGDWDKCTVLLVNPLKEVSTDQIFGLWDGIDRGGLTGNNLPVMALAGRNDLQSLALTIVPDIGDILNLLESTAPLFSRMSGSGATCFALYSSQKEAARATAKVNEVLADAWIMTGKIG